MLQKSVLGIQMYAKALDPQVPELIRGLNILSILEIFMTVVVGQDTAKTRRTLNVGSKSIAYYSIPAAQAAGLGDFSRLPAALKVVLENMLRFEDGKTVSVDDIKAFAEWGAKGGKNPREIAYRPARVLMQDFTGVPPFK